MDTKTFADVHASIVKKPSSMCNGCGEPLGYRMENKTLCAHCIDPKACSNSEPSEEIKLALSYAKDIVNFFPQFTIRQIPVMASKIKALKEALEMVK